MVQQVELDPAQHTAPIGVAVWAVIGTGAVWCCTAQAKSGTDNRFEHHYTPTPTPHPPGHNVTIPTTSKENGTVSADSLLSCHK